MRLIRQRASHDCGTACLAMLAGVPYRVAKSALPVSIQRGECGLSRRTMCAALAGMGSAWTWRWAGRRPLVLGPTPPRGAVLLEDPVVGSYHWVCLDDPAVLDPEFTARRPLARYSRREWWAVLWVIPA